MQQQIIFSICRLNGKERADKLIAALFPEFSRSRIQQLIDQSMITTNNVVLKNSSEKLLDKTLVEITIPEVKLSGMKPAPDIELNIVYEDDDLMVINKQAGLTVHPGAGNYDDTLVNALIASHEDTLSGINGEARPGIVHRLDRDTTGLMIVAKNDTAHKALAEAIKTREVTRIYHALVWNCPSLPGGKIEANIGRHPKDRKKMAVLKSTGKDAITHYKLIQPFFEGALSLVECKLETGRTHQIRVHFEHKTMPLVGDGTYAGQITQKKIGLLSEAAKNAVLRFPRQALHARYIAFTHPVTFEEMEFEAPYPEDFAELLKAVGYEMDKINK